MTRTLSWVLPTLLLVLVTANPGSAQKNSPPRTVQDDANLFSLDAEAKANAQIAKIKSLYGKDLFIETLTTVPQPKNVKANNKDQVKTFFDKWAQERFAQAQVNGVFVGIVVTPPILRVVVGPETQKVGLFTLENKTQLTKELVADLKTGNATENYDPVLLHAVDYVRETMAQNHRPAAGTVPPPEAPGQKPQPQPHQQPELPSWTSYLCVGLAVFAVFWLIMGVFRGRSASYSQPGMGGPGMAGGPGMGGGGFFSSLLGGLFGAAGGMWLYNNFFGGNAHAGGYPPGGSPPTGGGYSQDPGVGPTDVGAGPPSVSGGDWGGGDSGGTSGGGGWDSGSDTGSSGGGDWGGGGGDWGGGDAGGGGGDW
jgi:hypothetical protein